MSRNLLANEDKGSSKLATFWPRYEAHLSGDKHNLIFNESRDQK